MSPRRLAETSRCWTRDRRRFRLPRLHRRRPKRSGRARRRSRRRIEYDNGHRANGVTCRTAVVDGNDGTRDVSTSRVGPAGTHSNVSPIIEDATTFRQFVEFVAFAATVQGRDPPVFVVVSLLRSRRYIPSRRRRRQRLASGGSPEIETCASPRLEPRRGGSTLIRTRMGLNGCPSLVGAVGGD